MEKRKNLRKSKLLKIRRKSSKCEFRPQEYSDETSEYWKKHGPQQFAIRFY